MHPVGTLLRFIWQNSKRMAVFVVGVVLLLVGLVMIVTPGPGMLLIIAGLAVLATEFVWAERMLDRAKASAAAAANKVPGTTKVKNAVNRMRGKTADATPEPDIKTAADV